MQTRRIGLIASGLVTGLILLAACNSTPETAPDDTVAAAPSTDEEGEQFAYDSKVKVGKLIAETRCSTCHAIGPTGNSPHQDAKPFEEAKTYAADQVEITGPVAQKAGITGLTVMSVKKM